MLRLIAALFALTFLSACSGTQLLNSVASNTGKIERDIAYGALPRQKLDIYSPKIVSKDTPILVFYHGGSWQFGSKDDYRFLGTAFAARGIQTIVVNYRLYPEVIFPSFVEDGAKALAFTKSNLAGGRPIFIAGHSAGAHIATMVALDPRFLAANGTNLCDVAKGIIGIAGPYGFTPNTPALERIFPADVLASAMPLKFAATRAPPTLLLHGLADTTVLPTRSTQMMEAMRAAGNVVETQLYPGVNHTFIIGAVSPLIRANAPTLADIVKFIDQQKAAGYPGCRPL
jgi:acetyl esterase/lipase